ncbi:Acyl-CoA thioesterase I precursor [Tritonibacter multivorans]|uniref:Acyl-CoA thioesterase I n=1 Tax=Tritonibacter multivorans TaxID=928856 RepID=A0A0N7LZC9_9RHOB|nr:arylesterase [Tritonibacter multivorans]MDA7422804.1 arylesterase [Tritonibacter multivorans]CUH77313.1 Acyl-CoA thioesterase I precursor [Tritonibacter multivorans]SFD59329.1 acyl-CoA thioesterase-1 [Tritonibacter multivorans]
MRKQIGAFLLSVGLLAGGSVAAETGSAPLQITAFGDSLVQGYGLPQGEGLVPQLEAWLRAEGADVTVTNAGVSGDTTAGGAARVAWTLSEQTDVLVVLLGGNDLLRGLPPEQSRANLHQILSTATQQGVTPVLIGMKAPLNYGAGYKTSFDAIYTDLAAEFDAPLVEDAFAGMRLQAGEDPQGWRAFMQADGIHPNRDGVAANIAVIGPVVLDMVDRLAAARRVD